MRIYLVILLIPALIPFLCVVHTAFARTSYEVHSCFQKRQNDFVIKEGNLYYTTVRQKVGDDSLKFHQFPLWKRSEVHIGSFIGGMPSISVIPATDNSVAAPGTNIVLVQTPMWLISAVLLIPFWVFLMKTIMRRRKGEN